MKPFSVNLSKFKKIAHDKKSTTLQDPDGHEIRVVHSKLPAIQRKQLEGLPMYAEGGDVAPDQQKPVTVNVNQAPTDQSQAPAAQFAQQPVDVVATQPNAASKVMSQDQTLNAPSAVQLEQKAIREQQAVDAAKGAAAANMEQGYINQKSQIAQQEQNNVTAVKQHADEFSGFIRKNPIDNNHWAESQSTGQKVSNALGLILGGFKQGLVGGNNPALDFINTQIERDVASQRARADQQKNIYGAYRELYGDQVAATAAAKASMTDVYAHKAQQIAAQLGTPQAQANADALAAKLAIDKNQLLLETSGRLGTLNVGQPPMTQAAPPAPAPVQTAGNEKVQSTPESEIAGAPSWYSKTPIGQMYHALNPSNPGIVKAGEKETEKTVNTPETYEDNHILVPDASKRLKQMQYGAPAAIKGIMPELTKQFTAADQAEKAAGRLDEVFPKLAAATEKGGVSGRMGRSADSIEGALGGLGTIVSGVLHGVTGTETNRSYDEYQNSLIKYIANALRGTNVSDATIHDFVKTHSPEYGDSPAKIEEKRKEIKQFILDAPETSLLKQHGFSRRTH